jgi:hypothetical protein
MSKVVDLLCNLLFLHCCSWLAKLLLEVKDSRGSISETLSTDCPLIPGYLIVKVLKLMDNIIKEMKRCKASHFHQSECFHLGPLSLGGFQEGVECHLLEKWVEGVGGG